MWDFIDKAIYINLDHREDRRQIMKKFFEDGKIPAEKVERFSAIKDDIGLVGCAMSHIAILKMAKQENWKRVLILEDDLEWDNFDSRYPELESLVNSQTWDVCMLGGLYIEHQLPKIKMAVCTNAYIVQSHYYDTLLDNFESGLKKKLDVNLNFPMFPILTESTKKKIIKDRISSQNQFNVDTYWFKLQERDNWIGTEPMFQQLNTFSDIYNTFHAHPNKNYIVSGAQMQYFMHLKNLMDL
jgi:glycosyl transferase family 25